MTLEEVRAIMKTEGINSNICLLYPHGFPPGGALCLRYGDDYWYHVFTTDRPPEAWDKIFPTESDALTYFLVKALSEPTYRTDFKQSDLSSWNKKRSMLLKKYNLQEPNPNQGADSTTTPGQYRP